MWVFFMFCSSWSDISPHSKCSNPMFLWVKCRVSKECETFEREVLFRFFFHDLLKYIDCRSYYISYKLGFVRCGVEMSFQGHFGKHWYSVNEASKFTLFLGVMQCIMCRLILDWDSIELLLISRYVEYFECLHNNTLNGPNLGAGGRYLLT